MWRVYLYKKLIAVFFFFRWMPVSNKVADVEASKTCDVASFFRSIIIIEWKQQPVRNVICPLHLRYFYLPLSVVRLIARNVTNLFSHRTCLACHRFTIINLLQAIIYHFKSSEITKEDINLQPWCFLRFSNLKTFLKAEKHKSFTHTVWNAWDIYNGYSLKCSASLCTTVEGAFYYVYTSNLL